jgi:NADP-dependent 3-hydroxy acid dehydrogenase YdfG
MPSFVLNAYQQSMCIKYKHAQVSYINSSPLFRCHAKVKLTVGIGQAIAHHLLSHDHKLILVSRTHSALDQLHYQYGSDRVEVLAGDMADPSLPKRAVDLANERWGRLDSVIINHGTLDPVKKVAETSAEEWRKGFDVNVFSTVALVQKSSTIPHTRSR